MPKQASGIAIKRVYDPPAAEDGQRVLVDRLWPRGISKARIQIDAWIRDLAPSTELRRWFNHDPARWEEFQRRYREELRAPERAALLDDLAARARAQRVTLLYGARDTEHNEAVVLRDLLEQSRRPRPA
ncbi:MAG: DUF488 domain-containing protein [Dehalococcoidia bacterium]|nr:DUF488 domain-containing protein [Dehalococcoidia bacterium]